MSPCLIVAFIVHTSRHNSFSTAFTTSSSCEPTYIDGACSKVSVYIYLFYYNCFNRFYFIIEFISLFWHTAGGGTTRGTLFGASLLKASKTGTVLPILFDPRYLMLSVFETGVRKMSVRWKKAIKGDRYV